MDFPLPRLLLAVAFGFGGMAAPAALVLIEAANAPRPEVHDPAYARNLLTQGRLTWESDQASAGGSTLRGDHAPDLGSGD